MFRDLWLKSTTRPRDPEGRGAAANGSGWTSAAASYAGDGTLDRNQHHDHPALGTARMAGRVHAGHASGHDRGRYEESLPSTCRQSPYPTRRKRCGLLCASSTAIGVGATPLKAERQRRRIACGPWVAAGSLGRAGSYAPAWGPACEHSIARELGCMVGNIT